MLAEELTKLRIYLSTDTTVVLEEIREASNHWSSVILMAISLRLGTKNINPLYYAHLKNVLSLPNCIGLIGGKPTHALYLIGRADEVGESRMKSHPVPICRVLSALIPT